MKSYKANSRQLNESTPLRVCVIGSGTRFLSGISYYTNRLANALAKPHQVSVILMRQLLPTFLYPGRKRVGASLTQMQYEPQVQVFDGVDWYWLPSIVRALAFVKRELPDVMVFQWWTGTVLHSYLLLALAARLLGIQIIIEFHEVLDPAEAKIPLVGSYVKLVASLLMRLADGFVIHSEFDRPLLEERYKLGERPVALISHGPYDQYQLLDVQAGLDTTQHPNNICNLLFFGTIRPYKGLEDLIRAFDAIPPEEINKYWLTIVGETWEGWTLPAELIANSRYADRITFINRYVRDEEVSSFFAAADAVVLPYHRSSASGPLHIAMSQGLPIVVTNVGGLTEVVTNYEGAILIPPQNPVALQAALAKVITMRGQSFADPHSWERNVARYNLLFDALKVENNAMLEVVA